MSVFHFSEPKKRLQGGVSIGAATKAGGAGKGAIATGGAAKAARVEWRELHAVADSAEAGITATIAKAFDQLRIRATTDVTTVQQMDLGSWSDSLQAALLPLYTDVLARSWDVAVEYLPPQPLAMRLGGAQQFNDPYHDPATGKFTHGPGGAPFDPVEHIKEQLKQNPSHSPKLLAQAVNALFGMAVTSPLHVTHVKQALQNKGIIPKVSSVKPKGGAGAVLAPTVPTSPVLPANHVDHIKAQLLLNPAHSPSKLAAAVNTAYGKTVTNPLQVTHVKQAMQKQGTIQKVGAGVGGGSAGGAASPSAASPALGERVGNLTSGPLYVGHKISVQLGQNAVELEVTGKGSAPGKIETKTSAGSIADFNIADLNTLGATHVGGTGAWSGIGAGSVAAPTHKHPVGAVVTNGISDYEIIGHQPNGDYTIKHTGTGVEFTTGKNNVDQMTVKVQGGTAAPVAAPKPVKVPKAKAPNPAGKMPEDYHVGKLKKGDTVMVKDGLYGYQAKFSGGHGTVLKGKKGWPGNILYGSTASVHLHDPNMHPNSWNQSVLGQQDLIPTGATEAKLQKKFEAEVKAGKLTATGVPITATPAITSAPAAPQLGLGGQVHPLGTVVNTGFGTDYEVVGHNADGTYHLKNVASGVHVYDASKAAVDVMDVTKVSPLAGMVGTATPPSAGSSVVGGGGSATMGAGAKGVTAAAMHAVFPFKAHELTEIPSNLEGMHTKVKYQDPTGQNWLWKPNSTGGTAIPNTASRAEVGVYDVMRKLGLPTPDCYQINMGGKDGSIQKMFDTAGAIRTNALRELSAGQIEQVQQHHVVDWLMSQHDTNDGALLMGNAGQVYAVDKGQAFKFFGKDELTPTYKANQNAIAYVNLMEHHIHGELELNENPVMDMISKVEAMPDSEYADAIRPYAEERAKMAGTPVVGAIGGGASGSGASGSSVQSFVDAALARKHSLRKDFEELYKDLHVQRAQYLVANPVAETTGLDRPQALTRIDAYLPGKLARTGWAGQSILLSGKQLENGNLLAYEMHTPMTSSKPAGKMLVIEGKLRNDAEPALLAAIGNPPVIAKSSPSGYSNTPYDPFWGTLEKTAKHVNGHLNPATGDQQLNGTTMGHVAYAADDILYALNNGSAEEQAVAKHYDAAYEKVTGHTASELAKMSGADIESAVKAVYAAKGKQQAIQYTAAPVAVPTSSAGATATLVAAKASAYQLDRTMKDGEIHTTMNHESVMGDTAFHIDLGDGVHALYTAHGDNNPYSKMGRIQLHIDDYTGDHEQIKQAVEKLNKLGIDTNAMTPKDAELLLLTKQARALNVDQTPDYKTGIDAEFSKLGVNPKTATVGEQIAAHKAYWGAKLGVSDVAKLPGYHVLPEFDSAHVAAQKTNDPGGWAHWNRIDVTEADLAKDMPGYVLGHSITGMKGMSSSTDQGTGGSSYSFTRITNSPDNFDFAFDPRLLLRTDSLVYPGDKYGNSNPSTVKEWHQMNMNSHGDAVPFKDGTPMPTAWKAIAQQSGNETDVKNGISLLDHVARINAGADRNSVIAALHQHGLTHLNGKPVEDVVTSKYGSTGQAGAIVKLMLDSTMSLSNTEERIRTGLYK